MHARIYTCSFKIWAPPPGPRGLEPRRPRRRAPDVVIMIENGRCQMLYTSMELDIYIWPGQGARPFKIAL